MAERKERPDTLEALQIDVERIWKTLELNRETIRLFDEPIPMGTKSTDTCSCSCTDQASPVAGCIMTVYHD
jgi:hypothetical protein